MKISNYILKGANTIISYMLLISFLVAGVYAGYALWDNSLVFAAVDNVQADMLGLKPEIDEFQRPSFDELLAINEDVVGWVTLDNTNIDYPVLQGQDNLEYFNKDIFGNFSLGGSIYLDSRNDPNFEDDYSLLYGHFMERGRMFGDLELYREERFFENNQTGSLMTPEEVYDLEIYATLVVGATDEEIFNPTMWNENLEDLIEFTNENALYINEVAIEGNEKPKVLAFTTCTTEFTDARTVVLAIMN